MSSEPLYMPMMFKVVHVTETLGPRGRVGVANVLRPPIYAATDSDDASTADRSSGHAVGLGFAFKNARPDEFKES